MRSMDFDVARRTVSVLCGEVMCGSDWLLCPDAVILTVALQAELRDSTCLQQAWVRGSVRIMTSSTSFRFHRSVFIAERPLFIGVTLDTSGIGTSRQTSLLGFETAMCVVTVAATHRALEHLVMERLVELMFGFAVALHA